MPPIRMRERGRAKKGTMLRLLKQLFKLYPGRLIINAFCIVFNVFANLCSSIFSGLIVSILNAAIKENGGTFNIFDITRMYTGSAMEIVSPLLQISPFFSLGWPVSIS